MCGISGFTWSDKDLAGRMNAATKHRGPDGTDVFTDGRVTFGHNLLAITETPANSSQPVVTGDAVLAYNGEIYNYRALRTELEQDGEAFATDADTEVLFTGLRRYGRQFLERLDGMFALAFYDRRTGNVLLARDPSGIKPLYWARLNSELVFSSELRGLFQHSLSRRLNADALRLYSLLGYVPGPATLIAGIAKLCPGQWLSFSLADHTLAQGWFGQWRTEGLSQEAGESDIRSVISSSVQAHTMGLRPFGLYLSGGLDSTVILHELAQHSSEKVRTYTTRFDVPVALDREFNEDADTARRLCADYQIEHHELVVRGDEYADAYTAAVEAIEEPRWNAGIGAYWLLAREAAKDIVVVLNGSGGDELFFGYPKYLQSRLMSERYARWPDVAVDLWYSGAAWAKGRTRLPHRLRFNRPLERWAYLNRISNGLSGNDFTTIIRALDSVGYPAVREPLGDTENAVAEMDRLFWLADEEYIRTDKIAMQFGMEGRFPLMGRDVVRLANAIPSTVKLQRGTTKHLLRQAYRGTLPDYIINKRKTGWKAPVAHWMDGSFGRLIRDALAPSYYDGLGRHAADMTVPEGPLTVRAMKKFLPLAALRIWAQRFKITA